MLSQYNASHAYRRTEECQRTGGEGAREIGRDGSEPKDDVRRSSCGMSCRGDVCPGTELEMPLVRMPRAVCAGALTSWTGEGERGIAGSGGVGGGPAEAGALKC